MERLVSTLQPTELVCFGVKLLLQDLDQYPHVLLLSPHEWDPSVLNYSYPSTHGYPSWAPDPSAREQNRAIHTLSILSDIPTSSVQKHNQQPTTIDYNKSKPYFGWVNAATIKKTFENSTQWAVTSTISYEKTFQ